MPRSRGRSAPARSAPSRSASTMAAPSHTQARAPAPAPVQHAPVQGQRQPGLFSQMASTAAGVAVGSAAGHTIANGVSSIFGGGSSSAPVEQQQPVQYAQESAAEGRCETDARSFTQCMDQNNGDIRVCQWYMDQLKACLGTSSQF